MNGTRAGAGRPLGFLAAWLRNTADYTDKQSHMETCRPSLDKRAWNAEEYLNRGAESRDDADEPPEIFGR